MEKATLKPFVRENLDVLFVGLNPAVISNQKGHYFSVKQSLWNQLYKSGLILQEVDKDNADELIFGNTELNVEHLNFGITDLVTDVADSNSGNVEPTEADCKKLEQTIRKCNPRVVIILHSKILKNFIFRYLKAGKYSSNSGEMGRLLNNCKTVFYNIAFPHGNAISDEAKITRYREVKELITNQK